MGRPTKEEAQEWWDMAARAPGSGLALTPLQTACLAAWLWRVRAALPSAAAVQRDQERRKRQADQGVPLCRGCHTHHDSGERCPE